MKKALIVVALVIFFPLTGCDTTTPAPATTPVLGTRQRTEYPVRRFVPINTSGDSRIALDTVTGQACRTWNWAGAGHAKDAEPSQIPLCINLFNNYPTVGGGNAALPPGAKIIDFTQPGGGKKLPVPKVGEVEDGYRFKGGDPADKNNWEKVQRPANVPANAKYIKGPNGKYGWAW